MLALLPFVGPGIALIGALLGFSVILTTPPPPVPRTLRPEPGAPNPAPRPHARAPAPGDVRQGWGARAPEG